MTKTAKKNSGGQKNDNAHRGAADQLLQAAINTDDLEAATRLRVVAALLYGQEVQKIRRNLSVTEDAIKTYKARYDRSGIQGLMYRLSLVKAA